MVEGHPQLSRSVEGRSPHVQADPTHSDYLQLVSLTYGDLDGDGEDEAVVDLRYGSGGTANWHYLYIFQATNGHVAPLAVLQSGSRAYGGLQDVNIRGRLLVLDFADPDRREGDCCSRGVIRVRYRWHGGRFVEAGQQEKDSIRFVYFPLPKTGPNTVDTRVQGHDINIVYRDEKGTERAVTTSGMSSEPSLSSDGSTVVFLSKPNDKESEIRAVRTDGSGQRLLFSGDVQWNGRVYPSSCIRSPQWSVDGQAVYFVTDFTTRDGALWRLDVATSKATVIIPDAVMYGVIQTGQYKGFLIANQRSAGESYPVYPFFLYTPLGGKIRQVGEETEDLDQLVADWEGR